MEIHIVTDASEGANAVADAIESTLRGAAGSGAVLGLATGSSPVPAYTELIRRHREEGLSFASSQAFLLDEYVGLAAGHEQSYHHFIRENFTAHIDIDDAAVVSPDGNAEDPAAEAAAYDEKIREAGEWICRSSASDPTATSPSTSPSSSLASRTHVVGLTQRTIAGQRPLLR